MSELPQHGVPSIELEPFADDAVAALRTAGDDLDAVKEVAGRWPAFLAAWATAADLALAAGQPVDAYAYARVGYHRGLDAIRAAGWRGDGHVRWEHQPNRGFLRSLRALGAAAAELGEEGESTRVEQFLARLDPPP